MIKKKIFIATAVFASICMLGGCATSKSSKKAAEATTEAAQQAKATPVKLNASEYVKLGQYKRLGQPQKKIRQKHQQDRKSVV